MQVLCFFVNLFLCVYTESLFLVPVLLDGLAHGDVRVAQHLDLDPLQVADEFLDPGAQRLGLVWGDSRIGSVNEELILHSPLRELLQGSLLNWPAGASR